MPEIIKAISGEDDGEEEEEEERREEGSGRERRWIWREAQRCWCWRLWRIWRDAAERMFAELVLD